VKRVVADSNVYVSAIVFGGKPMTLLDLADEGDIELFVSDPILSETVRILRDKFQRTTEQLEADRMHLATITRSVTPTETLIVVSLDPDDDRILECAVAVGATTIVTGDKHLLGLGSFRGIRIQTPAEFLGEGRDRG
jgi:putative PIN family toxin of toxin-antitoxin system